MSELSTLFKPNTDSVSELFSSDNTGYFIPLYQRKYSWSEGNVVQLMADICYGANTFLDNSKDFHFLGVLIFVEGDNDSPEYQKLDQQALPRRIRKIIDGQQRLSTIAVLACHIYKHLQTLKGKLPQGASFSGLASAITNWQKETEKLFSFDLGRGDPERKPIIIRGESDTWTEIDKAKSTYISSVSAYLSSYITAIAANRDEPVFPPLPVEEPLRSITQVIEEWLDRILTAHKPTKDDEPQLAVAWDIVNKMSHKNLWEYQRPDILNLIVQRQSPVPPVEDNLCSIAQGLAFCYYFLRRCCFTTIMPTTEEGAFDMFQSLNATGTPLTAIETFKPLVTNTADTFAGGYQGSAFEMAYEKVDSLFEKAVDAAKKNSLTNEFLTTFAQMRSGEKLSSQFSSQRMWLTKSFDGCTDISTKIDFVRSMGDLATFWQNVLHFNPAVKQVIEGTEGVDGAQAKEAALSVIYLKDAGHTMCYSLLSRFYAQINGKAGADQEFVDVCKAVAAFFTLWRSAIPNKDLDKTYRKLLQNYVSIKIGNKNLNIDFVRGYLIQELYYKLMGFNLSGQITSPQILDMRDAWMRQARQDLRYDIVQKVCKFALLVAAHDTEPDTQEPGLVKIATPKTDTHLTPENWISADFKSIEHVAPQSRKPTSYWDDQIYTNGDQQRIGNLILLPTTINSTVGNKPWLEKWIYYRHLSLTDKNMQKQLQQEAKKKGINLAQGKALDLLVKAGHQKHIKALVAIGENGRWDQKFVMKRTERMCEVLWERMFAWLS